MEPEIFEGLRFLGAICPEFAELKPVGRTGMARYLELNRALWIFAREVWPRVNDPQTKLTAFLCRVLAPLFSEDREGERHWIFATGERYFEELDADEGNEWSGHREMAEGDLAFIYRMAPQKAITDLFVTAGPPFCDPLNYWDVMVPIKRLARIQPITFADLRADKVLGDWSVIRRRFQGVRCEPIPDLYFNRLVELLPCTIRRKLDLEPVTISIMGRAGNYGTEAEFSVEVVEKLFKQCGLPIDPQWPCPVRVGHQVIVGRADYQVRDGRAPLTVVECKLRIRSDGSAGNLDLDRTIDQAKSYALHLGLPSFVVASPEGFWVYSLERNQHKLELRIPGDRWEDRAGELKRLLLEIRDRK
jgi:hypothetical protein